MTIDSKEFWETVKSEYNKDSFICWSSATFSEKWITDEGMQYIKELAEEFLDSDNFSTKMVGSLGVLFTSKIYQPVKDREWVDVRVDFIDWCIKKFDK